MFNKYWREYPWFLQLFLFMMLVFINISFFGLLLSYVGPIITGVTSQEVGAITYDSGEKLRVAAFFYNGAVNLVAFLIPCALFAYAVHPRPLQYLGIKPVSNQMQWVIVFVVSLAAIPVVSGIAGLLDKIPLSDDLMRMKETFAQQQKAVMHLQTPMEFVAAMLMGALIAPIGEELLFRGVMMKFAAKKMVGSIFWPIALSSTFFALMHGNVVGFVSLLISGMILGYIYYLTGSILLSMFSHFVVNGTQLSLLYFGRNNTEMVNMMDSNETPMGLFIGGILLFGLAFYWLWKNRTPLPKGWTLDFTTEELQQKLEETKNL